MRYAVWVIRVLLFVAVLSFAAKNADPVTVRYYLGMQWQAPLIFVLLIAFCAGAAAGVVACLGRVFRQRRELLRLKGEVSRRTGDRGTGAAQGVADGN